MTVLAWRAEAALSQVAVLSAKSNQHASRALSEWCVGAPPRAAPNALANLLQVRGGGRGMCGWVEGVEEARASLLAGV